MSINVIQGVISLGLKQTPMTGPSTEMPMATPTLIMQEIMQTDTSNQAQPSVKKSWAEQVKTEEKTIRKTQNQSTN